MLLLASFLSHFVRTGHSSHDTSGFVIHSPNIQSSCQNGYPNGLASNPQEAMTTNSIYLSRTKVISDTILFVY